jgi:hypothetical protein
MRIFSIGTLGEKKANVKRHFLFALPSPLPSGLRLEVIYRRSMENSPKLSGSVIAAAVVAILAGLITLLGMSLGFFGLLLGGAQGTSPELPAFARNATLGFTAFLTCLSAFGIATGIGLILLRNWARISVLIWGGCSVFFGVVGIPVVLFMSFTPTPNVPDLPAESMRLVRLLLLFIYGLPLAVGLWWLILFNRKTVKAQFIGTATALYPLVPQRPRCPGPVAALAWLYITTAAQVVILPFLPFSIPLILFGHLFPGKIGTLFYVLNCLVLVVAGVGLLKLKPWSYHLTMGLHLLWFASAIGTVLHPNYSAQVASIITEINNAMHLPPSLHSTRDYLGQMRWSTYLAIFIPAVMLGVLVYYRPRFLEAASAAASAP